MDRRHLAVITAAATGCFALSIFVTRLKPFSSGKAVQVEAAAGGVLGVSTSDINEPNDRSPETYHGSVFYFSADAMLQALGVNVYPQDKVYAFPDPVLGIGSTIKVYRAQPVTVSDAGKVQNVRSWGITVRTVLAEQNIELGEMDKVSPALDTPVALGQAAFPISITRVAETQLVVNQDIDYGVTYKDDPTMEKGTTAVDSAGVEGTLQKTYLVRRENGVEVSRVLQGSKVTVAAVNKVVRRGTKIIDYGSGGASWYVTGSMTAAHRTLPFGTRVLVTNTANGRSVVVTIADRGPFVSGRIIDLSKDAFAAIGSIGSGVINVRLEKAE